MMNKKYKTGVNERGRHLRSTAHIKKNDIVFQEIPLCFLQSLANSHNGVITCHHCNSFLGGPDITMQLLSGNFTRQYLLEKINGNPSATDSATDENRIIPCSNNCGIFYCSEECKQNDTRYNGHNVLCTGIIKDGEESTHPLYAFKIHACENNEIFLIIGQIIVSIISKYTDYLLNKSSNDSNNNTDDDNSMLQSIMKPFLEFCWKPWWDIMDDEETSNACLQLCQESSKLLKDTLLYYLENYDLYKTNKSNNSEEEHIIIKQATYDCLFLCTYEYFGRIIGSFELNCIGVRYSQPNLLWEYMNYNVDFQKRHSFDILTVLEQSDEFDEEEEEEGEDRDDSVVDDDNGSADDNDNQISNEGYDEAGKENDRLSCQSCETIDYDLISYEKLQQYLPHITPLENTDDEKQKEEEQELIDEILTPLDGTAMFSITCQMNHSCKPNVYVVYNKSKDKKGWGCKYPLMLQCIALRDIEPDEELCISYIDQELSYEERVSELNNYHFSCTCVKCIEDKSNGNC